MAKKHILICDDEEGIRESLKLILEENYELTFADNGNQCLSYLQQKSNIDLILLDIKMPQINGLDVLKHIKKIRPDIKVVIVSGYKSVETAAEASRIGADDYITKPFEKENVLAIIERIVQ